MRRGVIVRALAGPPNPDLPGFLRVTVGTRDENTILIDALETLVPQWFSQVRIPAGA
jgi:histidinol-phosphate/aromatic aminotransferase/cobyric acid decarboxylase-like protein